MEQLINGAKFPAKCVKNEIHNLLTTLRLTRGRTATGPQALFHTASLRSFQRLFEDLTFIHELHELDTVAYLKPFLEVITSDATDGQVTAVALGSVDKFVSFGLVHPDSPGCMEAVNTLAWGVINCRFISSGSSNDEAVLLKMVGVLLDCLRCPAGAYLSDACVWNIVRKCFQISRMSGASQLLRSSAEGVLQQMVLTVFGTHKTRKQRVCVKQPAASASPVKAVTDAEAQERPAAASAIAKAAVEVYNPYGFRAMHFVLRFLAFLLAYGRAGPAATAETTAKAKVRARRPRSTSPGPRAAGSRSPRSGREGSPGGEESESSDLGLKDAPADASDQEELIHATHCLGLSLLNVALESGGDEIARSDELISVIQDDICKSLLQNSRTASLSVLSLTLRAIFNLFLHFRRHLKVQLEIFFTSVHLKIACLDAASYEQREIALESLLEFCREPELMLELYENYDCDVRCTNIFETLVKFLVTNAFPSDGVHGVRGGFSTLHRLALSGLLSILHSIALRCEGHGRFRGEGLPALTADKESPGMAETELSKRKEQKRRLTVAARTFNAEPSKSMAALQSLGLIESPPTPEGVAAFLRHTPGLDLRVVGEYIAKRKDFNGEVRKAFMDLFPFTGMGIVEGLRLTLSTFRLPGEAQLIERLMESFAEWFFSKQSVVMDGSDSGVQDPLKTPRWIPREKHDYFAEEHGVDPINGGGPEEGAGEAPSRVKMLSSDTIFVLAYSIIMLNTDLHSAKVFKKMSDAEFVRNNRGIDNGKDLPAFFLRDIFEAIRDDEIRLHGDAPAEGESETVVDDFFWEGVLRRSETTDEFSTSEQLLSQTPPGASERDMLQVVMDCTPLPTFSLCYESVNDASIAMQVMTGFQDMARISSYFEQTETVNGLARVMCQYFCKASGSGILTPRAQIALKAALQCVVQQVLHFREAEWRSVLDVMLQLWALGLLPPHLTELDDFAGADGRPLETLCDLSLPYAPPADTNEGHSPSNAGLAPDALFQVHPASSHAEPSDGFLESLTRWFEDETRDDEHEFRQDVGHGSVVAMDSQRERASTDDLPVNSPNPSVVHQKVKQYVSKSGFLDLFTHAGIAKLPPDSLQALAKALVALSRPGKWSAGTSPTGGAMPGAGGPEDSQQPVELFGGVSVGQHTDVAAIRWHEVADPVFGLELLTNMTCMPVGSGQDVSQIWPLVSTHFEKLLQFVIAGRGSSEQQFIERLIVNTLRLCIRLIGNAELVPSLLTLTTHLSKLPPGLFATYSERIACGLLVLVKGANLPHSGMTATFALLKRISENPGGTGASNAGIECLNCWLSDDQELSRLLALQQFPELLLTLKSFASQNSTSASATALDHLSNLVPQMARGARNVQQAQGHWQALWVPTLHALADIAKCGAQRSSATAFVYLQRLLLERGTELSVPWEQVPFSVWKECLEQVLFPLLQQTPTQAGAEDVDGSRRASAAQLICRVVLTHMPDWLHCSPDGFPVLFLRLLHILVSEATAPSPSVEPLVESLKNLLLVISADPSFATLGSPQGGTLIEAAWAVVSPQFPHLRHEINLIFNPEAAEA